MYAVAISEVSILNTSRNPLWHIFSERREMPHPTTRNFFPRTSGGNAFESTQTRVRQRHTAVRGDSCNIIRAAAPIPSGRVSTMVSNSRDNRQNVGFLCSLRGARWPSMIRVKLLSQKQNTHKKRRGLHHTASYSSGLSCVNCGSPRQIITTKSCVIIVPRSACSILLTTRYRPFHYLTLFRKWGATHPCPWIPMHKSTRSETLSCPAGREPTERIYLDLYT